MATNNVREAQARAKAKLAERRQREDQLIDAAAGAVAARDEAQATLAAAEAALTGAIADLAELGIGRDELATLLEVSPEQLGGKARGRPRKAAAAEPAPSNGDGDGDGEAEANGTAAEPAADDGDGTARPAAARSRKARAATAADGE
jgi:hypothetical protein